LGDKEQEQSNVAMWELARRPVVVLLLALRFLPTIYYGMSTVLVPLMINQLAGNKTTVAMYGTASLVIASAAQLLAGRAADHFGHRWPTLIGYGLLALAALGLAAFAGQLWGVFVFGILGIAVAWALAALLFCLVSDGVPRVEHGSTFGLLQATWSIAMMGGAMLGGALTRVSPGLPFLVAGLLNSISIVLTLAFFVHVGRKGASAVSTAI
jgi:MFS family permease